MCGIIGILGQAGVSNDLVGALQRLEYRGYDSAGIATVHSGKIIQRRSVGKIAALKSLLQHKPTEGRLGIGHTRWATHGGATRGTLRR